MKQFKFVFIRFSSERGHSLDFLHLAFSPYHTNWGKQVLGYMQNEREVHVKVKNIYSFHLDTPLNKLP